MLQRRISDRPSLIIVIPTRAQQAAVATVDEEHRGGTGPEPSVTELNPVRMNEGHDDDRGKVILFPLLMWSDTGEKAGAT